MGLLVQRGKYGAHIDMITQLPQHLQHSLWVVFRMFVATPQRGVVWVWWVSKEHILGGCLDGHHSAVVLSWLAVCDYT